MYQLFYNKYLFDMYNEQNKRNGSVPNIIPTLNPRIENYAGNVLEENIYKKAEKLKKC